MADDKNKKGENKPKIDEKEKAAKAAEGKAQAKIKAEKAQAKADKGFQKADATPDEKATPPRLREIYKKEIVEKLKQQFNYTNTMEIPKLVKVTINMGLGDAIENAKILDSATEELGNIAGQKAVITRAKKSIANFKLRQGMPIGAMVTLRSERMFEFLDRLINVALPRVRDFKGVPTKSFDGKGNYSLGLREQIIFPEINYDRIDKVKGMNITIVTTAKTDEEGRALLTHLGMPFRK
jgi:large subunit ribosomal protein L5